MKPAAGYRGPLAYSSPEAVQTTGTVAVIVAVVGLGRTAREAYLYDQDEAGKNIVRRGSNINPYLVLGPDVIVAPVFVSPDERGTMIRGNMPTDGGNLVLSAEELRRVRYDVPEITPFLHHYIGSDELINGKTRGCLWIEDDRVEEARKSRSSQSGSKRFGKRG
jgi:hypothetical protein